LPINNNNSKIEMSMLRKKQHIDRFLKSNKISTNYFDDIILENNSLPELNFSEIDASSIFLEKKTDYPIMINAITGGFDGAFEINRNLALLAKKFNIPIAVGSQSLGIKGYGLESYKIVRDTMENGIVIANVSANTSPEMVDLAIEMIKADAVQLHLNVAQEMCMKEGDRNFKGTLENICNVSNSISVPVIAKEVGFGLSGKVANRLFEAGIRYIDIGGKGGSNFIEIENMRNEDVDFSDLYDWGLPTPLSLIQCVKACPDINIISSGGISKAMDAVKSISLGSKMTAISGILLRELLTNGYESSEIFLKDFLHKFKIIMLLTGCKTISELRNANTLIKGNLLDLISQ